MKLFREKRVIEKRESFWIAALCGAAMLISVSEQTLAQDSPEIAARRALAKSEFMLRQAKAENATLETQVTELQAQLKAAQDSQQKDSVRFADRETKYVSVLEDIKAKYLALADKYKQSVAVGRQQEASIAKLQDDLGQRVAQIQSCTELNAGLLSLNNEFLAAYENKSAWDALFQGESVTGLKQVDIENRVQELRDRNEDLRLSLPDTSKISLAE